MVAKLLAVLAIVIGLLTGPGLMFGHHSLSAYRGQITLAGTATDFVFENPHAQIHFDVKAADGSTENWSAETSGTARLTAAGWSRDTIKPGDPITAMGRPAKDGSKRMFIEKLLVNGKEYSRGSR